MYMKVFGQQITTDISPVRNVFYLTGEMAILLLKNNRYTLVYKKNPAYWRQRISRLMRKVEPIQFWNAAAGEPILAE